MSQLFACKISTIQCHRNIFFKFGSEQKCGMKIGRLLTDKDKSPYLRNSERQLRSRLLLITNRNLGLSPFRWHENHRSWMTLKGHYICTLLCRSCDFVVSRPISRPNKCLKSWHRCRRPVTHSAFGCRKMKPLKPLSGKEVVWSHWDEATGSSQSFLKPVNYIVNWSKKRHLGLHSLV